MGDKRREKNKLTREAVLKLINKSEDEFKTQGASIREMIPVFDHYGIQVRIFDVFINPIFKYQPQKYNHHIPTLYAITKNNHIYTCNDNVKMLQQMLTTSETRDITVRLRRITTSTRRPNQLNAK